MICKFEQNEVTSSNIGKSVEETSRATDKHEQISNDVKRKSQAEKEEDIKESSPEKRNSNRTDKQEGCNRFNRRSSKGN